MKSPYNKIVVYDLETGGLYSKYNAITEIAMVAIDLETLEIVDELDFRIFPELDLREREIDPIKEAKILFKNLGEKDSDTNIKTLKFKGQSITPKSIDPLVDAVGEFLVMVEKAYPDGIISYAQYLQLLETDFKDIAEVYFDHVYNPQALEVTKITKKMIVDEGVMPDEAFKRIDKFISDHTHGNKKPILAGHNIKKFDNDFLTKLYNKNKGNLEQVMCPTQMIDTLEWARLRWFELPNYQLGTCANAVDITLTGAHRALADTIVNAKFLIKLLKGLRGEGSQESKYVRRKFEYNF